MEVRMDSKKGTVVSAIDPVLAEIQKRLQTHPPQEVPRCSPTVPCALWTKETQIGLFTCSGVSRNVGMNFDGFVQAFVPAQGLRRRRARHRVDQSKGNRWTTRQKVPCTFINRSSGVKPDRVDRQLEQRRGELPDGGPQGSNAPPDHLRTCPETTPCFGAMEKHGLESEK